MNYILKYAPQKGTKLTVAYCTSADHQSILLKTKTLTLKKSSGGTGKTKRLEL
jgi:hypothetical protein